MVRPMIREEHLDLGIAEGIITAEQAAKLRALAASVSTAAAQVVDGGATLDPDDERFRLIGGFNDIFVAIGVLLLVSALFGLSSTLGFGAGFAFIAMAAAWALSEVFSRRLKLALPAITLALMFAGAGGIATYMIASGLLQASGAVEPESLTPDTALFGLGAALFALLHLWRFRVPIDTAIAAGGLVCAVMGCIGVAGPEWAQAYRPLLWAFFGALIFVLAVRIDATDPLRMTRRSDVAFWLHLLAAPMIVNAVSSLFFGPEGALAVGQAVGILALFAAFGLVALVLDRRALLVSALSYAGIAIGYLLSESIAKDISVSLTLLGLAALVLLLSAQWRRLRRAALARLPLGGIRLLVPPAS